MNSPLVSFIIPYFNAGVTIQETIESVFNQSYANFDIWIINDGSTDPFSIEKLKDFEANEKIHILHQENAGPSVARNSAIKLSQADFILPIDADNRITPDSVRASINFLEENPLYSAVYGDFLFFGEKLGIKKTAPFEIHKAFIFSQVDTCALMRKDVFNQGFFYDTKLSKLGLEDWEFWINLYSNGFKFKKLDIVFFEMRVSHTSRTYEVANKNIQEIKNYVFKKHAILLAEEFNNMYYKNKMLLETPDYRIGKFFMSPYRFIKKKLFGYE